MENLRIAPPLFALLLLLMHVSGETWSSSKISNPLRKFNKSVIKSIQSPDGDIIDCVLIEKQPAFEHPLLRNSKIQVPPFDASTVVSPNGTSIRQTWHRAGETCPEGTIPILRTTKQDVLSFKHGMLYGALPSTHSTLKSSLGAPSTSEFAVVQYSGEFYGVRGSINVWEPAVESDSEFTQAKVWVSSGTYETGLNTIEAGWQVNPGFHGDRKSRPFVYWTRDAYQGTGCYNLKCPGFVQVNKYISMGAAFDHLSTLDGQQRELPVRITKSQGSWWLYFNEELMGYWPQEIFTRLTGPADSVTWGGIVKNLREYNRHTKTQMGSGKYSWAGHKEACYLKNFKMGNNDGQWVEMPIEFEITSTKPNCYDMVKNPPYFFFGGPGFSFACQ